MVYFPFQLRISWSFLGKGREGRQQTTGCDDSSSGSYTFEGFSSLVSE